MKCFIKFIKRKPGVVILFAALIISLYLGDKVVAVILGYFIVNSYKEYNLERINKKYTDWLESQVELWHDRYMQEKHNKQNQEQADKICKN